MTRFADNIERIRVIEIVGDLVGGPHENVRCTRAFNVERFSSSRREPWCFGSVSIAFQSPSCLPMVVPMAAGGSYVSIVGGEHRIIAGPAPLA